MKIRDLVVPLDEPLVFLNSMHILRIDGVKHEQWLYLAHPDYHATSTLIPQTDGMRYMEGPTHLYGIARFQNATRASVARAQLLRGLEKTHMKPEVRILPITILEAHIAEQLGRHPTNQ